ncbi:MAG TPA: hypothetical protein VFI03_05420 [Solirubrobacterales bacterium]|nr:hypothetical protein [Solirubrobacterales bacterium]
MSLRDRIGARRQSRGAMPPPPPAQQVPAAAAPAPGAAPPVPSQALAAAYGEEFVVDLQRRRDQLVARVAELQWDLGGLVYEMAIRDRMQMDLLVKRAVVLQDADAELSEVERIVRMEETGAAGSCGSCGAPHSSGATFCWQCGQPLLRQVSGESILRS